MFRESAGQGLRQIRALYSLGAVGGLTDRQLVEQFVGSMGSDREDAFAALVQRHGPMVLSVCRRMLWGRPTWKMLSRRSSSYWHGRLERSQGRGAEIVALRGGGSHGAGGKAAVGEAKAAGRGSDGRIQGRLGT